MAPPPYSSFLDTSVSVPACIGRASFVFCSSLSVLQRSLSFPLDFSPLPEEDRRVLCVARYTGVRCRWGIYIYIYISRVFRVSYPYRFSLRAASSTDRPTDPSSTSSFFFFPSPFFSFFCNRCACMSRPLLLLLLLLPLPWPLSLPWTTRGGGGEERAYERYRP